MSTKTTKKTTVVTHQKSSTPSKGSRQSHGSHTSHASSSQRESFSSGGSSRRTPSPARLTRMQEKEELTNLNDRLANYIDRVRYLETENSRLSIKIQESEEVVTREVTGIKSLYESELAETRRLLDITSKENARLKLDLKTVRGDYDECKSRCAMKDRDLKDADKTRKNLESRIAELQLLLNESENRKAPLDKELSNLRSDVSSLRSQLATAKKQLEEETLLRIELANRVQSTKEDLDLSRQVHEQELNETRSRLSTTYEEIDGRVQSEYETRLQEALYEMRQEHDQNVQYAKNDIIGMYDAKIQGLEDIAQSSGDEAARARADLHVTLKKSESSVAEINSLKIKIASMEQRMSDLEDELQREKAEREIIVQVKDEELRRLRQINHDQTLEYADLLDVKLKLDMEIAAYRKLLEGEEARLNMSHSASDSSLHQTPGRGQKRKRTTFGQSRSEKRFSQSGSSKEVVVISEVDTDAAGYIKLYNNSDEEFALGGWTLKHMSGDQETTFKFHRTLAVQPNSYVTVWGSDSNVTHSPPTDLVMKGQKWFVGDDNRTVLVNQQGDERADMILTRSYDFSHVERAQEATEKDRCNIM